MRIIIIYIIWPLLGFSKMGNQVKSALYDPDLPTASEVMASLCCVATQYAKEPSLDLATLASSLANTLTAPEYAETKLIVTVAKRLAHQWDSVLREYKRFTGQQRETQPQETQGIPVNITLQ